MNARIKGNKFEEEWSEYIQDIDPDASRNRGSGAGVAKSDVHNSLGYEFECCHSQKINIWKKIEEAERHASEAHTIPAVVFKADRILEPYIAIPAWHFKELVKKFKQPKSINPDRTLGYELRQLSQLANRISKKLEK